MNVDNASGGASIDGGGTIKMRAGWITDLHSTTKGNVVTSDNKIIGTGHIQLDFINLGGTLVDTSQDTSVNPNGVTVGGIIIGTYRRRRASCGLGQRHSVRRQYDQQRRSRSRGGQ